MKSFHQLREELEEINFKLDHKKNHISSVKIKTTEVMYHSEKPGSKKVRVFVKPKGVKEFEELGVFKDMKTAEKSASQFVKLMGEDMDEGVSVLKTIIERAENTKIDMIAEAKEFPQSEVDKLEKMTDVNDHNGSVLYLAKMMKERKVIKMMELLIQMHKAGGHMTSDMINIRKGLLDTILLKAKSQYSNYKDVYNAF
ncbi:MAG: hypothetical protein HOL23_03905 [Gammaproteobacteria bacterium]|nr:hypothetical protein [Gammaproteobacteria bacterium]